MTDTVRLDPLDNVVTATHALQAGHPVEDVTTTGLVPSGHKIATPQKLSAIRRRLMQALLPDDARRADRKAA